MLEDVARDYVNKVRELLEGKEICFSNVATSEVPEAPGVYVIFNEQNEVIYVGRTINLRRRLLREHRRGNVNGSQFRRALSRNFGFESEDQISGYIDQCTFKFKIIEDSKERIRLEHFAIAVLAPILNTKLEQ